MLPSNFQLFGFPFQVWEGAQSVFKPYCTPLQLVIEEDLRSGLPDAVAGTIVTGGYVTDAMAEVLRASDRPTVIVGSHVGPETGACCVECDLTEGMQLAVKHLHELGHRNIGFVNGPLTWRSSNQKLTGFIRGVFDYKMSSDFTTSVEDPWNGPEVTEKLRTLLEADWREVTALVCAYESIGAAALVAASSLGLSVPQHLSVVACHDEGTAGSSDPPLTTIALPVHRMGKLAALLVVSATRNKDVIGTRFVVPPTLVVRQSTAAPRRRQ